MDLEEKIGSMQSLINLVLLIITTPHRMERNQLPPKDVMIVNRIYTWIKLFHQREKREDDHF